MNKVKIMLDADVIIHFAKGGMLNILPSIFSNYDFIVLDKVYNEVKGAIKKQLDNQILILKNISILPFPNNYEIIKEYSKLKSIEYGFGDGESACMAYCRFFNDVIGSSNLNDVKTYCSENRITYITTVDFFILCHPKKYYFN